MLSVDFTYYALVSCKQFCPFELESLGEQTVARCPFVAYDPLAFDVFVGSQPGVDFIHNAVE